MAASGAARAVPNETGVSHRDKTRLLDIIRDRSLLTGGTYKLASGATSDWYLDMKPTTFDPEGLMLIGSILFSMLQNESFDAIGGLELGAVPIIAAVCQHSWNIRPFKGFVVRKERKGHGTDKKIDGNFRDKMAVVLIDDVTTKGGSVMEAVTAVRERGGTVKKIITIVDRQEGATERLANEGIPLVVVFTRDDLLRR